MHKVSKVHLLIFMLIFFVVSNPVFAEDSNWKKDTNSIYLSLLDLSYISNFNGDGKLGIDLGSLNTRKKTSHFLFGESLLYSETDFKITDIDLFPFNFYFNTIDLYNVKTQLSFANFFYCHWYPINFSFTKSSFSYKPYCLIGNETIIGSFGFRVGYKIDKNFLDFSRDNVLNNFRIKFFLTLGGYGNDLI